MLFRPTIYIKQIKNQLAYTHRRGLGSVGRQHKTHFRRFFEKKKRKILI